MGHSLPDPTLKKKKNTSLFSFLFLVEGTKENQNADTSSSFQSIDVKNAKKRH